MIFSDGARVLVISVKMSLSPAAWGLCAEDVFTFILAICQYVNMAFFICAG